MSGIISYGSYLPYFRLQRGAIAAALGVPSRKGTRSVASYDEDATSMGVEASRAALRRTSAGAGAGARALTFATTRPPYLDKTNATAIHAALALDSDTPAFDMVGSVRSAVGALRAALDASVPTLAVAADIRIGLPGGADESEGGDGAAALLCGPSNGSMPLIASYLGGASATGEFLDRWRQPGDLACRVWEERFGEHAYVPLAEAAIGGALKQVGIAANAVDHVIVTGAHARSVGRVAKSFGAKPEALADDLAGVVGNTGAAHPGLLLANVLDQAAPGETIALVVVADGADVLLFRTTDALADARQARSVARQLAATRDDLAYAKFQIWRGVYRLEPPRRPDPAAPAAPPSFRSENWKFAFVGSKCVCGTRHLPPTRVCMSCGAVDRMFPERLSDVRATIATFTIDRLAFSESPPAVVGVLDFDGGGRYQCELTEVDPAQVGIGDRVEMTFRRMFTANGVHNYFWKARPIRGER